ncbi:MAG: hypothetical protein RBR22_00100 [Desulfuromonas sp.]|nr:hypothetical protein [Desulfuromonas sp.]
MKKITFALVWLISFVLLLLVCDQFLLRYPGTDNPILHDFQSFYKDLRKRVLALDYHGQPHSVQQTIIEHGGNKSIPEILDEVAEPDAAEIGRYIYVDEQNTLNFADSLQQIPAHLRASAKKLDQ